MSATLTSTSPSTPARPRVMVCFGTRPEVIKLAPVIERLDADDRLEVVTVSTAQHREMLDQALEAFELVPDVDLGLMSHRQHLSELASRAIEAVAREISAARPEALLVQGDTTSALCAALAAFYARVPVGHVEAGLRTRDPQNPFPEEINRRLIAPLARWHFCPTDASADNLRLEGFAPESIVVTQNTVVDALLSTLDRPAPAGLERLPRKRRPRRILVTLHRRETQGEHQRRLCRMFARLAERPDVELLFPVHLSPAVRESVFAEISDVEHIHLLEPLDYRTFAYALASSDLVLTDSGGIQEEAPSLDVPVVVLRETTERPEGVAAGCARLAGTDPEHGERTVVELLDDPQRYERMARAPNPYGDGRAATRIVDRLKVDLLRGWDGTGNRLSGGLCRATARVHAGGGQS